MTRAYKELEILVAKIQRSLAPDAQVSHDVKILGKFSKRMRQIDVLVRKTIGQYSINIAIDCKDYSRPADVKTVEEFHGLIEDVAAHVGALVCPLGFTSTAKERARSFGICLYSPVDTDPHKWQVKANVSALCDFRTAAIAFGLKCSALIPFSVPYDFDKSLLVYDEQGKALGTALQSAMARWNEARYPAEPGHYSDMPIFAGGVTAIDNGYGVKVPVELYASLHVEQKLYLGKLAIEKISGFKDELTGNIVANAFTMGELDPRLVEETWQEVSSDTAVSSPIGIRFQGLVAWAAGD